MSKGKGGKLSSIANPVHRQIIGLFTTKSSARLSSAAKSKLHSHISMFSLNEIPRADVLAKADDIKASPNEAFPRVLQFERRVSTAYFDFVLDLWKHQRSFDPFAIWSSYTPQMYRMLRCLAYQFPMAVPDFALGHDSGSLPYVVMKALSPISIFVLKMKGADAPLFVEAFLDLMEPLCSNLRQFFTIPSNSMFNADVLGLITTLCVVVKEVKISADHSGVLLVRCVAMLQALLETWKIAGEQPLAISTSGR
jgi:hypothetical protein